ncbi:putative hexose transporter [Chiua virens]|nr:putative hexose transporter [Chiua virens]
MFFCSVTCFFNDWDVKLGLLGAIQVSVMVIHDLPLFNPPLWKTIGSLAAVPFSPYMTDGLGRRFSVFFGAAVMIIAAVLQTASQSVQMFIVSRFIIGFGLGFATNAAPLLVTELAYPSQRGVLTSMYNSLGLTNTRLTLANQTYGTFHVPNSWAWRIPSALQGLPSVIQVCLIWFVPESPRWLVNQGREAEALRILAYYHANGNERDALVEYEFEEIKEAIKFDREVSKNVGWSSLFKTVGNRKRMRIITAIACFSQWSGNGLLSYCMWSAPYDVPNHENDDLTVDLNKVFNAIGITSPSTQLLIVRNASGSSSIDLHTLGTALCDKAGRRPLFLISAFGMLITWTLQTACFAVDTIHHDIKAGYAVIAMIFLYSSFYTIAFTPLVVSYTVEILPFALRAKGFTYWNFIICISLIFNQYVNPIAFAALGWKYYLVYVFWIAFEAVFLWFYVVETKNRTLEETAALFDGEDAMAQISEKAAAMAGLGGPPDNARTSEERRLGEETPISQCA